MAEDVKLGQRLLLCFDNVKSFTHKTDDGQSMELQRVYHLDVPYGAPYEEVFAVLEEFVQTIKENEKISKERAAKELEAQKEAQSNTSVEDTSVENTSVEDAQEKIANL